MRRFRAPWWGALALTGPLAAGLAPAAWANPVVYDFSGPDDNTLGPVVSFGAAPFELTVSAFASLSGTAWTAIDVARRNGGLGANSGIGGNPAQIDSNLDQVEGLLFDFGSASFSSLTVVLDAYRVRGMTPDSLDAWIGSSFDGSNVGSPLSMQLYANATPSSEFTVDFGMRYLFIAAAADGLANVSDCDGNTNCFRVAQITAVPEPASLAMMLAGLSLGGLMLAARRRSP